MSNMIYKVEDLIIYTDGSCRKIYTKGSYGFGAWGFVALRNDELIHQYVNGSKTPSETSQRAELKALIAALEYAFKNRRFNEQVIIYTDSAYAYNGSLKWVYSWQQNGWVKTGGGAVANVDLWKRILPYLNYEFLYILKVKGHEKNVYNNLVDKLVQNESLFNKQHYREDTVEDEYGTI